MGARQVPLSSTATAELHGDDYARGSRYDFAVTVAAGPRPPWLEEAIARGVQGLGAYPDDRPATRAVAARHGRDPAGVIVLNGAAEAFTLIARALVPRLAAVVHPSFTEPERALRDAGLRFRRLVLPAPFSFEPRAVPEEADLVVIGNPTNPTGSLHPAEALRSVCREGRTTVVDEAFMDFVSGGRESLSEQGDLPGLIVVRSLTKVLGLPGVRAGYLLADGAVANRLRRTRPQWPVNALALAVTEAAANRSEYIEEQSLETARRREHLVAELSTVPGVRCLPASANFVLLELPDAVSVHQRLLAEHGISTRPGWTYPGLDHRHLRVAVRGDPLDGMLVAALGTVAG
jgi:histidinol-phosphate aminotransferase